MANTRKIGVMAAFLAWVIPLFPQEAAGTMDARGPAIYQYPLLRNKATIELCKSAALKALPGVAIHFQAENSAKGLRYRFEIQDQNKTMWAVLCNPETMEITDTLKLD